MARDTIFDIAPLASFIGRTSSFSDVTVRGTLIGRRIGA
jgi:hypothetical protein